MSNCSVFITYTELFADTALAGTYSSAAFLQAVNTIAEVNVDTFDVPEEATKAKNILLRTLYNSYDQINIEANSTTPMIDAFRGLSKFLKECSGMSVDNYLIANGLKVNSVYASIAEDIISESNIE